MSIIRAEVSGYHHIGFYDTEFIIKGILHIDTRQYNFLHYDGAFGFSRLEIKAGKVKASYDEAEGFQMQQGKETPEGGLLNVNRKDAIKQIQEAATSYLTTDLNAWAEYFNLATRSAGPFAYTLTKCIAFPNDKYRCTITPAPPYCELIYNFGFDGLEDVFAPVLDARHFKVADVQRHACFLGDFNDLGYTGHQIIALAADVGGQHTAVGRGGAD